MTASRYRNAQITVAANCVIAAACFAGAVSERALFGFVYPGLVLTATVAVALSSMFSARLALVGAAGLALAWGEIANAATGVSNGPAARSTFAVAALTALALAAVTTRMPALFLLPVGGIVAVALLYGSGGEVPFTAVLTCGAAVVALARVESAHRRWSAAGASVREPRKSLVVVVFVALAAMAASAVVVSTQVHHDHRRPHDAVTAIENSAVRPPWRDPFIAPHVKKPRHGQAATPPQTTPPPHQQEQHHGRHISRSLLIALGVILLGVLSLGVWVLVVRRAWSRTRRRLRAEPPEGVVGAWIWVTLRFRAYRKPLPPQLSPDRVYRGDAIHEVPPHTAEPLRELGLVVAPVAFGSHEVVDSGTVDTAWRLATTACAAAENSLSRIGRLRLRFVSPPTGGVATNN